MLDCISQTIRRDIIMNKQQINNKHNEIMDLGFRALNKIESMDYKRIYKKDLTELWNLTNKIYNLNTELKVINLEREID